MYYEKLTKYKTKVNMSKYREDIQNIFNALLKEDTTFENYYLYKEDYDIFIDNIIGKIVSFNIPPFIMNEDPPLLIDKTIFIKPKEKSVIGLMKKIIDTKPNTNPEIKSQIIPEKVKTLNTKTINTNTLDLKTLDLTHDINIV